MCTSSLNENTTVKRKFVIFIDLQIQFQYYLNKSTPFMIFDK